MLRWVHSLRLCQWLVTGSLETIRISYFFRHFRVRNDMYDNNFAICRFGRTIGRLTNLPSYPILRTSKTLLYNINQNKSRNHLFVKKSVNIKPNCHSKSLWANSLFIHVPCLSSVLSNLHLLLYSEHLPWLWFARYFIVSLKDITLIIDIVL